MVFIMDTDKGKGWLEVTLKLVVTLIGVYVLALTLAGGWMIMNDIGDIFAQMALAVMLAVVVVIYLLALRGMWQQRW